MGVQGSGGGFSAQFDQTNAQWQAAATAKYLKTPQGTDAEMHPEGSFPPMGRGTPDVSALGKPHLCLAICTLGCEQV